MLVPLALTDGSAIVVFVVVVMIAALAFIAYTRTGSGIEQHPHDGSDGAPGAARPSELGPRDDAADR